MRALKIISNLLILLCFISASPKTEKVSDWRSSFEGRLNFNIDDGAILKELILDKNRLSTELANYQNNQINLDKKINESILKKAELSQKRDQVSLEVLELSSKLGVMSATIESTDMQIVSLTSQAEIYKAQQIENDAQLESLRFALKEVRSEFDFALQFNEAAKQEYKNLIDECLKRDIEEICLEDESISNFSNVLNQKQAIYLASENKLLAFTSKLESRENVKSDLSERILKTVTKYEKLAYDNSVLKVELADIQLVYPQKNENITYLSKKVFELIKLLAKYEFDTQKYKDLLIQESKVIKEINNEIDKRRTLVSSEIIKFNQLGIKNAKGHAQAESSEIIESIAIEYAKPAGVIDGVQIGKDIGKKTSTDKAILDSAKQVQIDSLLMAKKESFEIAKKLAISQNTKDLAIFNSGLDANYSDTYTKSIKLARLNLKDSVSSDLSQRVLNQVRAEIIKINQGKILSTTVISPSYQETFTADIPKFPGIIGTHFNNKIDEQNSILNRAYTAGYNQYYENEIEKKYYKNVSKRFNEVYEIELEKSKFDTLNNDFTFVYEDEYQKNYSKTFTAQYEKNLEIEVKVLKSTYGYTSKEVSQVAYDEAYTQNLLKEKTSISNRASELVKGILIAKNQTADITSLVASQLKNSYNLNLVKVTSIKINDLGNEETGKDDGVFQNGDYLSFDIYLTNYSSKPVSSLKFLVNGREYIIPEIPANMNIKVRNAAISKLGDETKIFKIQVIDSKVNSNVYASSDGVLYSAESQIDLSFPLSLEKAKVNSTSFINEIQNISLYFKNSTSRDITGPLEVIVTNDLGEKLEYNKTLTLKKNKAKLDIFVTHNDIRNLYKSNHFDVLIKKGNKILFAYRTKGVQLKVKYDLSNRETILLTNSSTIKNRELIRDNLELVTKFNYNVVDLALTENLKLLSILKERVFVLIDSDDMLLIPAIDELFSKSSVLISLGKGTSKFSSSIKKLKSVKDITAGYIKTYRILLPTYIDDPMQSANSSVLLRIENIRELQDVLADTPYIKLILNPEKLFELLSFDNMNKKLGVNFESLYLLYDKLFKSQLKTLSTLPNRQLKGEKFFDKFIAELILNTKDSEASLFFKTKILRSIKRHRTSKKFKRYKRVLKNKLKSYLK